VSSSPGQARRVQLLVSDCASDLGERPPFLEDLLPDGLRYKRVDARETSRVYDLGLNPPRLVRETHEEGPGKINWTWSYDTLRGQACDHNGCVPMVPEARIADASFARDGWKTTRLGECAMLLDGAGNSPDDASGGVWVPHGATASVRVLLSEGTLYVEVTDDVFVTQGAVVDTLVIESSFSEAMPGERGHVERIRMDGTVTDRDGKVHKVEVATGPSTRRFALKDAWARWDWLWRLSYEDTDDGRTVGATLATSRGNLERRVFASPYPCVPRDGALHVDRPATDPEKPIVP
jgi:hypothetical protein